MDDVTELNLLQKPGLLLTVDYSQAFDIISKDCMQGVFEKKKHEVLVQTVYNWFVS